jgi:hypothetical protein
LSTGLLALPPLGDQVARLIALGLHTVAGLTEAQLRASITGATTKQPALLAVDPSVLPASTLAPSLALNGQQGFVVSDMKDVDDFAAIDCALPPAAPLYLIAGIERGDEMANWSPDEALPAILAAGRSPLTLTEGIWWVIQQPDALERNRCFMTIGSRLTKPTGVLDARTPALWISNGTGRDGSSRRNAPKVGWCWAGNRHTWLGFASAADRRSVR